jgi:hypothetical protein
MATLFGVSVQNIGQHLAAIFASGELETTCSVKNFFILALDKRERNVKHYNLDAIISVGYRVNSIRATQFRQWATGVLRHYLQNGFALDHARLLTDEIVQVLERLADEIRQLRLGTIGRVERLDPDPPDAADWLNLMPPPTPHNPPPGRGI